MKKIIAFYISLLISVPATATETGGRQTIQLSEVQRDHVQEEMRALLSGIQHILDALSRDDMMAVAKYAGPLGMGMAHKAEDHLKGALPEAFMQLGMSVHEDFDRIAADAISRQDSRHILHQLSDSMRKCVACHATYQIRTITKPHQPGEKGGHHGH